MTKAMPFLQKYDITFLRPPTISGRHFFWTQVRSSTGSFSRNSREMHQMAARPTSV